MQKTTVMPHFLRSTACALLLLAFAASAPAQSTAPQVPSDWDLLMLKLVNAARTDPAGENALRGTNFSHSAVPPLAYDPLVGRAAENHNRWMSASGTFSHYQTWGGESGDPPATGSPLFSGVRATDRITYVGFSHSSWGENILYSSGYGPVNEFLTDFTHNQWWTSTGHRNNLMSSSFAVLGYHAFNEFNLHWATQNFARPAGSTRTYLLGVLYDDLDESGAWEPHHAGDPQREGLAGINYQAYTAGTSELIGSGTTFDNGAFAFRTGNGNYDLKFLLPDGANQWVRGVALSGTNVDVGDIAIQPADMLLVGDYNADGLVNAADYTVWRDGLGGTYNQSHYDLWKQNFGAPLGNGGSGSLTAVPEPGSLLLIASALAVLLVVPPLGGPRRN